MQHKILKRLSCTFILSIILIIAGCMWPASVPLFGVNYLGTIAAKAMAKPDVWQNNLTVERSGPQQGHHDLGSAVQALPAMNDVPLVLIYAVLDNNLSIEWEELINNAEAGVHASINTYILIDGPGNSDTYIYNLLPDSTDGTQLPCPSLANATCDGRYIEEENFWSYTDDTAHPDALSSFISFAWDKHRIKYNDQDPSTIVLSLVGHGSGWGANVLPAQPSIYSEQPNPEGDDRGGMLWDDHAGAEDGSRSLSTHALGVALQNVKTKYERTIDLLYLDACSMGIAEVAYELRNSAKEWVVNNLRVWRPLHVTP